MKHLDEGLVLAVRDGAEVGADTLEHLERCTTCASALEAAHRRSESIEHALTALDKPVEATAAKAGVRARVVEGTSPGTARRWSGWHLGRAAALLLVTAGAAAALPGSPLRTLLLPPVQDEGSVAAPDAPTTTGAAQEAATSNLTEGGIAVAVPDGPVEVIVRGADPGTEVSVEWTARATASVSAPPGSRFTYSAGRIEVDASRGSIRVALPSDATEVVLEVDGVLYLRGSPRALEVTGPAVERTSDGIRFRVDTL
jgi:hypothetical protein